MKADLATIMLMGTFLLIFSTVSLIASVYVISIARKYREYHEQMMEVVNEVGQQLRILIDNQKNNLK